MVVVQIAGDSVCVCVCVCVCLGEVAEDTDSAKTQRHFCVAYLRPGMEADVNGAMNGGKPC